MSKFVYFVSMQKVTTDSEEFDCWAFLSESGEYHLAYLSIDGSDVGFIDKETTPEEYINFSPSGLVRVFSCPVCMKL